MGSRYSIFLPRYSNESDADLPQLRLMAIRILTPSAEKSERWRSYRKPTQVDG